MRDTVDQVIEDLLELLRAHVLDTTWSSFDSGQALVDAVERIAEEQRSGHNSKDELKLLFAPTGALQETALNSGFHEKYMRLAARFDRLS